MIALSERRQVVQWIADAMNAGARLNPACEEAELSIRTYQRWTIDGGVRADARPDAKRPTPANKLSDTERRQIVTIANEARFASLPPSQIVPRLADEGAYVASEASFYRVLKAENQLSHRGRAAAPVKREASTHIAQAPNEAWCWDITYLPASIKGEYFYLYLMHDLFSRKIVGWEVHEEEEGTHAAALLRRSGLAESIAQGLRPLVLHADNGSPMKSSTLLTTMQLLGVVPSDLAPKYRTHG